MQQAAELSVAAPTIEAALDARFLSGAKDERVAASDFFQKKGLHPPTAAKVSFAISLSMSHEAKYTILQLIGIIRATWEW